MNKNQVKSSLQENHEIKINLKKIVVIMIKLETILESK